MNSEIHNAYVNALLADMAYVNGLQPGMTGGDLGGNLQLRDRMTAELANYIGANFTVITQWTDPGLSGFSVTVFMDRDNNF
jgi:hypothetical protein